MWPARPKKDCLGIQMYQVQLVCGSKGILLSAQGKGTPSTTGEVSHRKEVELASEDVGSKTGGEVTQTTTCCHLCATK